MEIKKSTRKNKKYMATIDGVTYHFGSSQHAQYKDRTDLKLYSHLDHNDKKRQRNYFKRHSGVSTRKEAIEKEMSKGMSAKLFSHIYLW